MAYKVPTDLPQLQSSWQEWFLAERVRAAMHREDAPVWAKLSAVAITLVEQPGKIPVGNCCGVMAQGSGRSPWGWREAHWARVRPVGYALIKEGQVGLLAPFLAFAKPDDSLSFLVDRCVARNIRDGSAYCRKWVGKAGSDPETGDAYDRAYNKAVAVLWSMAAKCAALPMPEPQIPGWRDAGAGGA